MCDILLVLVWPDKVTGAEEAGGCRKLAWNIEQYYIYIIFDAGIRTRGTYISFATHCEPMPAIVRTHEMPRNDRSLSK